MALRDPIRDSNLEAVTSWRALKDEIEASSDPTCVTFSVVSSKAFAWGKKKGHLLQ